MRLKTSICFSSVIGILILLLLSVPVSAEDTWLGIAPQDQVIAWEKLNENANMANLFPYATAGTGSGLFMPDQAVWKHLLDDQLTLTVPNQPSVQPAPALGQLTIDGTPVSDLFRKAMDNYRANPPKSPVVPGANETIYSNQIPINWL